MRSGTETPMDPNWLAALVFLCLSALIAVGQLVVARILRVKAKNDVPTDLIPTNAVKNRMGSRGFASTLAIT